VPIRTFLWNEPPDAQGNAAVHVSAESGFAPFAPPIRHINVQADAIDGPWRPASPAGAAGTTTVALTPGAHTVHAFATDGQGNDGTGPRTSLPIWFQAPQPTVDIALASDRDGATIPHGSSVFPFQLSLVNGTASPQTFAFRLSLSSPALGTVDLIPTRGMALPAGVGFASTVHIPLPANLPAGTYTLGAVVFQQGPGLVDQSALTFVVP
jgi:hypothetical protein